MADRFAAWVVLLLVLLLPIFFALSNRLTDGRAITAEGLLGGGDLFLLAVALCAAAGEDLGNLRHQGAVFRLVVGVLLVTVGWSRLVVSLSGILGENGSKGSGGEG